MTSIEPLGRPRTASILAASKGRTNSTQDAVVNNSSADSRAEYDSFVIGTDVEPVEQATSSHQPFQQCLVAQGLSQLRRTASGDHAANLRLGVTGTDLDNSQAVAHCRSVQELILNHNRLPTLQALGQLQQLTHLEASHNQLTQVLDYTVAGSSSTKHDARSSDVLSSNNLRTADLSCNSIQEIRDLSAFRRLVKLVLHGNLIQHIGRGLQQLHMLQHLNLSANKISTCRGLEGLTSLRELAISDNRLSSLAPLATLTGLEVLLAANNELRDCAGVQGLSSLRQLDLRSNQLRRLEVLAACQGLSLLSNLDVADNPLEAGQNIRLYMISLLPQVSLLNGAAVSYIEKVDAANMAGAEAEGLMAIRKQYFPQGELDDGGGAVPPTAAGLTASRAEEELSCNNADSMFEAIVAWAKAVHPSTALGSTAVGAAGSGAAAVGLFAAEASATAAAVAAGSPPAAVGRLTRRSASGMAQMSSAGSRSSVNSSRPEAVGVAAIAAKLAAGCSRSAPWAQLQLARACYSWVVGQVLLPQGCSLEAGADLCTWDVGMHLFGESEQQVQYHQMLLQGHNGTYAECVSQLLVQLYHAVHMEAVQLSGFWKAGGHASVGPGDKLAAHNHSWVAVKVNGRWRLLDPVYAILRHGELPFYLPPEAFIYTHLPFESYWQLLPRPVSREQWWQMPEVALPFFAAGGQLLEDKLQACTVLPAPRESQVLPSLRIPVTAPATKHQYVCLKLLAQHKQLIGGWSSLQQDRHQVKHQQRQNSSSVDVPLVYQQLDLAQGSEQRVLVGHLQQQVMQQELWVSLPAPGTYYVHVELVSETPNWLQLSVAGLAQPLQLSYWQREDVIRIKVIVPPVQPHNPADGICVDPATAIAALPQPLEGFYTCGSFQLLNPPPCKLLEADRPELFEVRAPQAVAVAVGSDELGWQQLQPAAAADAADSSSKLGQLQQGLFWGEVVMPRSPQCLVAVATDLQGQGQGCADGSSWIPVISLRVRPQVQHIVAVPDPTSLPEPDSMDPALPRLRKLLAGLDVDQDGVASRKDLLLAFRRDRQLADHLKMQPRVQVHDGSFDKFLAKFQSINRDGLGYIDLKQLYAYMAGISGTDSSGSRMNTAADSRLASAGPGRPPRPESQTATIPMGPVHVGGSHPASASRMANSSQSTRS